MTEYRVFLKNKLFVRNSFRVQQYPQELDKPSKIRFGQQVSVSDDPFELYQMPSLGLPCPVTRQIVNIFNRPDWTDTNVQILELQFPKYIGNDGLPQSDLYTSGGVFKLKDVLFIEDSPRGPCLEILMNYLENLAEFHGITMPKFKLYREETSPLQSEDLNPIGGSSFSLPITTNDLTTFKLYGRGWYIKNYITQVQIWLDLFAKELGFTRGCCMPSWIPRVSGYTLQEYNDQLYNFDFKEGHEDPNTRGSSWTPKDNSSLGHKGKLYRNEHHRLFPFMETVAFPKSIYIEGAMHFSSFSVENNFIPEEYTPPPPSAVFQFGYSLTGYSGFIKEGSDYYYYPRYVGSLPYPSTLTKYKVPDHTWGWNPTTPIKPTLGTSLTSQTRNRFDFQQEFGSVAFDAGVPLDGLQQVNAGSHKYTTHKIVLLKTNGTIKKRYGITSSDARCMLNYTITSNNGIYPNLASCPSDPDDHSLTAATSVFGRYPFGSIKVTCGVLNNIGGFFVPPNPGVYPGNDPQPPWTYFTTSHPSIKWPYLPSHGEIIDAVTQQISDGTATVIHESDCDDIPFVVNDITGPVLSPGEVSSVPFIVNHKQILEEVVDFSPIFNLEGDFIYICFSYHDWFEYMQSFTTYDILDQWNALSTGSNNTDIYMNRPVGINTESMGGDWTESFGQPRYGGSPGVTPLGYSTYNEYHQSKINDGTLPSGEYWHLGSDNVTIVGHVPIVNPFFWIHVDKKVFR